MCDQVGRTNLSRIYSFVDGDGSMVAFNRIRSTVLLVSELQETGMTRRAIIRDVLPWADPYVAQLIKRLQDEVRTERRQQSRGRRYQSIDSAASAA
jgi:hypothetical protein